MTKCWQGRSSAPLTSSRNCALAGFLCMLSVIGPRKRFRGPITESIQRNPASAQFREEVNGAEDRPCQHFVITLEPGVNQPHLARMSQPHGGAGVGKRSSRILLSVPGRCTNRRQKMLHRFLVSIEELAI